MITNNSDVDYHIRLQRMRQSVAPKTFYAREAIIEHLEDLEDIYLAEKRLTEIRAGRSPTIPLKDLLKRHGM